MHLLCFTGRAKPGAAVASVCVAAVIIVLTTAAFAVGANDLPVCIKKFETENGTSFICGPPKTMGPTTNGEPPAELTLKPSDAVELRYDRAQRIRTIFLVLGCGAPATHGGQDRAHVEVGSEEGVSLRTVIPAAGRQRIVLPKWLQTRSVTVRVLPGEDTVGLCLADIYADLEEARQIEFDHAACEDEKRESGKNDCRERVIEHIQMESRDLSRRIAARQGGDAFSDAQRKWETWTAAECPMRAVRVTGPSAESEDLRCQAELSEARLWQLRDLND